MKPGPSTANTAVSRKNARLHPGRRARCALLEVISCTGCPGLAGGCRFLAPRDHFTAACGASKDDTMNPEMTRRSAMLLGGSLALAPLVPAAPAAAGRLKQSAARWCYSKISMDDLCRQGAEIGLSGIDLVDEKDWPTIRKYGLIPAMVSGAATIPVGWNRKENHDKLEKD